MFLLPVVLIALAGAVLGDLQTRIGCGRPLIPSSLSGMNNLVRVNSSGLQREYLLYVPKGYDGLKPASLILSFHGRGRDARYQQRLSQFSDEHFNPNAIVAYPNGIMNSRGFRQFQGDPKSPRKINDIQFTLDIIDQVASQYCIDLKRVFVAGKSNGGGLVNLLACDPKTSSIIAAFAPVSGAFYLQPKGHPPPCNPTRSPVPIINFHGWLDPTIQYMGGENTRGNANTESLPAWYGGWTKKGDCGQPVLTTLCSARKPVLRYAWKCHGVQESFLHYNISNLKHDWPSQHANEDGPRTTCFDATTLIMDFFAKNPLP